MLQRVCFTCANEQMFSHCARVKTTVRVSAGCTLSLGFAMLLREQSVDIMCVYVMLENCLRQNQLATSASQRSSTNRFSSKVESGEVGT